jgi:uncharacterized YigZ family protein
VAWTLTAPSAHQEEIRKSRFLALAEPVRDSAEVQAFFTAHAQPGASHHCWAWKIGNSYRFNDDGEPGGTAGRPILQAIESHDFDQVAVLVIRWFGGIKLGTGGLARAYGGVAAQCLRNAPKTPLVAMSPVHCRCSFADMAVVQSRFEPFQIQVASQDFDAHGVAWQLLVPQDQVEAFSADFTNRTRGQGIIEVTP